jgi:DNA-binding transcriptional MocR family regulator
MTIQQSDINSRPGPKYIAITDALSESIRRGDIKPGERLPTHRDLADTLGVTVATITRAYKEAISRGLISGEVGRGSFVKEAVQEQDTLLESFPCIERSHEGTVDLGPILPAQGDQDVLMAKTLKSLAERPDLIQSLLPYTGQPGLLEHHQQAGAQWLSRWIPEVDPNRVIATNGAQHALALAILSAASPGEVILAETMAWFGTRALATSFNVGVEALPMDEEGIIPEALERACVQHNPRLLICSSNCQNPTTATMSLERRQAIVDIARRYDLTLVEDGVFDFLAESPLPALTTLAPERTIYISSFSKCISPAMRIGFMYIPEALFPRITGYNRAMIICMPRLMLDIAAVWIMDGTADKLMDWQRAEFSERRKLARAAFDGVAEIRCNASWVWIDLPEPWTPGQFVDRAGKEGLNVWASEHFMLGRTAAPPVVRVSLGGYGTRDDVAQNLRILANCLADVPSPHFG